MIDLRANHDVDDRRLPQHLLAFGLRDAPRDSNNHLATFARTRSLERAQPAQLGIDLVRCFLADMAGIQDDEICILGRIGAGISMGSHDIRHAGGVVLIHLATIGLDEDLLRHGRPSVFALQAEKRRDLWVKAPLNSSLIDLAAMMILDRSYGDGLVLVGGPYGTRPAR